MKMLPLLFLVAVVAAGWIGVGIAAIKARRIGARVELDDCLLGALRAIAALLLLLIHMVVGWLALGWAFG